MLVTHHLEEEALPWFDAARAVFDELVIFVDQRRATAQTWDRARAVGSRVYRSEADAFFALDFRAMFTACNSDWIFYLDHDEELSAEWHNGRWRRFLRFTECTHFWFPRRWLTTRDQYIDQEPWWPDLQMRLFRPNITEIRLPTRPHEQVQVPGVAACFQNLAIHHHALRLARREEREKKVEHYDALLPGGALGHYYLHEDYMPSVSPIPATRWCGWQELLRMTSLNYEQVEGVSFSVRSKVPDSVPAAQVFWLNVELQTAIEPLHPCPPRPVRLSYHWIAAGSRERVVWDGYRSGIFPGVWPGKARDCAMSIVAPDAPGEYILQISVVQDGVCWFEEIVPDFLQEFRITVAAP